MLIFLLIIILAYGSFIKAKRKGKNPFVWSILTLVSFFCAVIVGEMIVVMLFYKGPINNDAHAMASNLMSFFSQNPAAVIFIFLSGLGGYLLINFLLDRHPDVIDKDHDEDMNENEF